MKDKRLFITCTSLLWGRSYSSLNKAKEHKLPSVNLSLGNFSQKFPLFPRHQPNFPSTTKGNINNLLNIEQFA